MSRINKRKKRKKKKKREKHLFLEKYDVKYFDIYQFSKKCVIRKILCSLNSLNFFFKYLATLTFKVQRVTNFGMLQTIKKKKKNVDTIILKELS